MKDASCLFCGPIDSTIFGENHIFGNERFHVVAGIGQGVNGGYVVIFPTEHVSCIGAMQEENITDFSHILKVAMDALGGSATIFEHGVAGDPQRHAHLHVVPERLNLKRKIGNDFPAAEIDLVGYMPNLTVFDPRKKQPLHNLAVSHSKNPEDYFLVSEGSGLWACWNINAGPYYLRTAATALLNPLNPTGNQGRDQRVDWHDYLQSDRDRELRLQTVARLKPRFL